MKLTDFILQIISDHSEMNEFGWLQKYKSLYYNVIVQPKGLPPIGDCSLFEQEPLTKQFYELYEKVLNNYLYKWDYEKGELYLLSSIKMTRIDY